MTVDVDNDIKPSVSRTARRNLIRNMAIAFGATALATIPKKAEASFIPNTTITVSSIAALTALISPLLYGAVNVSGYYAGSTTGGGVFVWNSASTATPDSGTIFQSNLGGTGRWIRQNSGEDVTLSDFGAVGDGVANDDPAWVAFHAYLSTHFRVGGIIYGGVYKISSSPNWAIQYLSIKTIGDVKLVSSNTSYGLLFDGGNSPYFSPQPTTGTWGIQLGRIRVQADLAISAIRVSKCHHAEMSLTAVGAITHGIEVVSCVSSIFTRPTCSYNEELSVVPTYGLFISGATGIQNADCSFNTPIMELGNTRHGILVEWSIADKLTDGTSEGNNFGIEIGNTCFYLNVTEVDFEANVTLDIYCTGSYNTFDGVQSTKSCIFDTASAFGNIVRGGQYSAISESNGATNNIFDIPRYNLNAPGALTLTTNSILRNALNGSSGTFDKTVIYNPTLLNSWINYGGGLRNAGYSRTSDGVVVLFGAVKDGTAGSTVMQLPVGFRPSSTLYITGNNPSTSGLNLFSIDSLGNVAHIGPTNTGLSLAGCSFIAEA